MATEFTAWAGYCDGKPHTEAEIDEYGECIVLRLFRNKKDAKKRYEDIRRVTMKVDRRQSGKSESIK